MTTYLDHAATSWPKAPGVVEAVTAWFTAPGVSPDRGAGRRCAEAAALVERARRGLAGRCGVPVARLAFTSGATEALNLLLRGVLRDGDHVVTTATDHSSVVRPLVALREARGITLEVVDCDAHGFVDPDRVRLALARRRPRLFVFSHASNVTGAVQDAPSLCTLARDLGVLTLVDASQTAGHADLGVGADMLVASAHKGLLAPPGLGFVAVAEGVDLRIVKQGGTGASRALDRHPEEWPVAFEAGTPNTPALAGLAAALAWHDGQDAGALAARALACSDALRAALDDRLGPRLRVQSPPPGSGPRLGILSFTVEGFDPAEIGALLDAADVHARTGFHCAPWIHRALGTEEAGTVRLSPGPFLSAADATRAVAACFA